MIGSSVVPGLPKRCVTPSDFSNSIKALRPLIVFGVEAIVGTYPRESECRQLLMAAPCIQTASLIWPSRERWPRTDVCAALVTYWPSVLASANPLREGQGFVRPSRKDAGRHLCGLRNCVF